MFRVIGPQRAAAEHFGGSRIRRCRVVPILLWLLGVPGLLIIVLLLLGVIRF